MILRSRHSAHLTHEARHLSWRDDRSLYAAAGDRLLTLLDADLRIVRQGSRAQKGPIALHPRAERLAVAAPDRTSCIRFDGAPSFERRHRPWKDWEGGDVRWMRDGGTLLAVCPDDAGDPAVMLFTEQGEVLAHAAVDVPEECGFFLLPQPHAGRWTLWAGAGQDGQWTYEVAVADRTISVTPVEALNDSEHAPAAFSPDGSRVLVAMENQLALFAHAGMRRLGSIPPPEENGDFLFGEHVTWLDAGRALASDSNTGRLYVVDVEALSLGAEAVIEGSREGDLWYFEGLGDGHILSVHGSPSGSQTLFLARIGP